MDEATIAMREAFMLKSTVKKQTLIRKIESASFVKSVNMSTFMFFTPMNQFGVAIHVGAWKQLTDCFRYIK